MSRFPLHAKVRAALKRLVPNLQTDHTGTGSRIGVAVSGGPDSVALLGALVALRAQYELQLIVLHVNHALRRESDQEQRCVEQLCHRWHVPCRTKKLDPPSLDHGLEAWARTERYQFFQQAIRQEHLDYVALAHTADDQAETVLFRLLRGSGRRGLAGMPAKRDLSERDHAQLIRPLLTCTRQDVLAYVAERQLPFVTDPSNTDIRFARNHIRHVLLPLLEQEFSPQIRRHLSRLAETLQVEEEWLESSATAVRLQLQAEHTAPDRHAPHAQRDKRLSVHGLMNAPAALRPRIVRQWIERAGALPEFGFIHLDQIRALCEGRIHGRVELPGDHQVRLEAGHLLLGPKGRQPSTEPYTYALARGHALTLPELGWSLSLSLARRWTGRPLQARLSTQWSALFDAEAIPDRLTVRSVCPGDRIFPLGMGGKKKIHDIFIDAKIPQRLRGIFPLIVLNPEDAEIAWVPGHVRGRSALVTETTRQVCQCDVSPLLEKPELC